MDRVDEIRVYKNGESSLSCGCSNCNKMSAFPRGFRVRYVDGVWYCNDCFPQAVDVYLAELRLREAEKISEQSENQQKIKEQE